MGFGAAQQGTVSCVADRGEPGSSASCPRPAEPLQHGSESPVKLNSLSQSLALLSKLGSAMLSKVPRPNGRACHNDRQQFSWHGVDKYQNTVSNSLGVVLG